MPHRKPKTGGGIVGGAPWAITSQSMTGGGNLDMPALFRIDRGRVCIFAFRNEPDCWHPMHLHGRSFNIPARNGRSVPLDPFVAYNRDDRVLHCQVIAHQLGGSITTIKVT